MQINFSSGVPAYRTITSVNGTIIKDKSQSNHNSFNPRDLTLDDSNLVSVGRTENQEKYNSLHADYYNNMTKLYSDNKTGLNPNGLENLFTFYTKEKDRIDNSDDTAFDKEMKLDALNNAFEQSVCWFGHRAATQRVHVPTQEEKQTKVYSPETKTFVFNQNMAIEESIRKLVRNFLIFQNLDKTNFQGSMMEYINKDSTNNMDINNLSLGEITKFIKHFKNPDFSLNFSLDDEKTFSDFFEKTAERDYSNDEARKAGTEWVASYQYSMEKYANC